MHENQLNQLILGAAVAASAEGHSVVALDTIFVNVNGKEKIADYEAVEAVVKQLCQEQKLYQNGNGYSTPMAYAVERRLGRELGAILPENDLVQPLDSLKSYLSAMNPDQMKAVKNANQYHISVVIGDVGTGKFIALQELPE